jgi:aerobic carbon-monoxide dehydrogenase medium subunit
MKAAPFDYHPARTVEEAVTLLATFAEQGGRIIAGGQSFVPMMAFRLARPDHLIDINGIIDLARLVVEGGVLRIGATVRHTTLETMTNGGVLGCLLREVARSIAHKPIRNRGTFCGSVVHADPSAEWCLVGATLGAEIVVRSALQLRTIPASDFFLGVMTTALAADELVTECRIPLLPDEARYGFYEVSRRAGDFALAAALVTYQLVAGRITNAQVGIGGVEAFPRRLNEVEANLEGNAPDIVLFRNSAEMAAAVVDPMEDSRNSPAFRRRLVQAVTQRALERSLP